MYLIVRVRGKRKRNFITYYFVVEVKPLERIDVLITASIDIYQPKKSKKSIPTVMKTCFSEGKLIKQFGPPPLFLSELPLVK